MHEVRSESATRPPGSKNQAHRISDEIFVEAKSTDTYMHDRVRISPRAAAFPE
jgi:hypothetical protein